jgi:5S rRNA maturation endonuclease (ribonuclease M5)
VGDQEGRAEREDGTAKPCLIVFDYLKLMSSSTRWSEANLAEFQVLGFMMTGLHNFAVRYKVPILTFIQLNRDGINVEDTSVASGLRPHRLAVLELQPSTRRRRDEEKAEQTGSKVKSSTASWSPSWPGTARAWTTATTSTSRRGMKLAASSRGRPGTGCTASTRERGSRPMHRTTKSSSGGSTSPYFDHARINTLGEIASYRVEELMDALGVKLRLSGKMYVGCCPVHGGSRPNAFNLYPDGHSLRGNWVCRTKGCDRVFKRTIIGFVRGVLSHTEAGWTDECGKDSNLYPWNKTIDWLCQFVGQKLADIKVDAAMVERKKFIAQAAAIGTTPELLAKGWRREDVRSRLVLPSPYYLSRGFLAETLDHFDVGESKAGGPMTHRVVVPVLDRDGRKVVGATGRSLWPMCRDCELWHDPKAECPQGECRGLPSVAKWRHTEGFHREHHLYNYGLAKDDIRRTKTVVVTEGPGDVWRLYEAGVRNAVALFGVVLNDPQQVLLEVSGAMNVILLLDADRAGALGIADIKRALGRTFRVSAPAFSQKDIGEMSVELVRKEIVPFIDKTVSRG